MEQGGDWIAFEHPLSERIRFLLRLEFLFAQYQHQAADTSSWGLRASLHTLLDILSVMGRADLRTELLKEVFEQHSILTRLSKRPDVNHARLAEVLRELSAAAAELQAMGSSHPAVVLRENEFLFAVLNRSSIPGGACGFDLPAYHRWLSRPPAETQRDLAAWFASLRPLQHAIGLYLRLLRDSTQPVQQVAEGGVFLHIPQAAYQLVRVLVPADADVYPEISAGKHRVSVRFMRLGDVNTRNVQAGGTIPFQLQCCLLSSH
ncbi:MAG TPA: cell division protein ZapD [Nevskia sp.]|nr:cell division protein ZapD [Nevskia sp.]